MIDPSVGVAHLIVGLWQTHKLNEWVRLFVSMGVSYCLTFSSVCGTALAANQHVAVAVGLGMVSAAGAAGVAYLGSPLTKKLPVTLPKELNVQANSDLVTIEKTK